MMHRARRWMYRRLPDFVLSWMWRHDWPSNYVQWEVEDRVMAEAEARELALRSRDYAQSQGIPADQW